MLRFVGVESGNVGSFYAIATTTSIEQEENRA